MANLYKKYTTKIDPKSGWPKRTESKNWFGRYTDADGVERRVSLSGDRKIAQRMLDDLVLAVEQGRSCDPVAEAVKRPILEHLDEFKDHLTSKNNTDEHVNQTYNRIKFYIDTMKKKTIDKIDTSSMESFLTKLRKENDYSLRTCNHYIVALKSFCNWLVRTDRLNKNPLLALARFNADTDKRHARRAMESEEFDRLSEAKTAKEREKREQSDFLKYVDSHGRFADFHGLRHTFVSNLCLAGVSPKTAQTLARHSDISLTMNIYSHVKPEEQAAAINALPGLKKPR